MMKKIEIKNSILIIDGHPLFREGFRAIVGSGKRFKVVGESGTGKEGFRIVKTLRPDLVVMELSLPDQDAVQLIRDIRSIFPDIFVMILSATHDPAHITRALQAGATGYVSKEMDSDILLKGLEVVLKGERFLESSAYSYSGIAQMESSQVNSEDIHTPFGCLTPREQEIMRLMAEGISRKEISESLCISPKTVENHAGRIMKKLSIKNIFELVRYAVKIGIIDVDQWKRDSATEPLLAQRA